MLLHPVKSIATDLVFVRHAETQANATGRYNAKTLNSFSALGERQILALTKDLAARGTYDRILVSPSPRAMRTILPYLKLSHQKATIWPLLYECCTQKRPAGAHVAPFKWGEEVSIPADCRGYFRTMPHENRLPVAANYNQGLGQVAQAMKELPRYLGGRLLLVGHSGQGGQLLHNLTGKWRKVQNAEPIRLRVS